MTKRMTTDEIKDTAEWMMEQMFNDQMVAQVQDDMDMDKLEQMLMTRDGDGRISLDDIVIGMLSGDDMTDEDKDILIDTVRGMLDVEIAKLQ